MLRSVPIKFAVAVVVILCTHRTSAAADEAASAALTKLLDDSWEFDVREDPLFATSVGDHRFNDRLPAETAADNVRRLEAQRAFLERWRKIDSKRLSDVARLNYEIFGRLLRDKIADYEFETWRMPITQRHGFHISFPELRERVPMNTAADYRNYIARLSAFDRYVDDHIEVLRSGIKAGLVMPAVALEGWQASITSHLVDDPTKSLFYEPLAAEKFSERVTPAERDELAKAAREAIARHVVPGYRKFHDFMEKEYVPALRPTIGASALPRGREFYAQQVRKFTTLDLSPEQVHETGLNEVKRIRGEMDAVIKKTGFEGDFKAFVEFLRTDPQFYATSPEQLMKEVAFVLKRMDGELPKLFGRLPRTPYGIKEVPAYVAPRTTTAYYMRPTGDGTVAGFYFVNTYNLKSRPLFEVEALSLHEAVPGHHLQLALQQELTDVPKFRRYDGFTAFIEGWGLYSERLGLEVGFYKDPYSDFGRLSYEMWRTCRLVVDTGMHHYGWTREQAIEFMSANTALALHNIRAEVDRYISWPGQALAYKIGELKIRELRKRAETELGDRFDIRTFHDVVLGSGSIPLSELEKHVEGYIGRLKGE